ncbi:uncharacterized protein [Palaemon carinicauda]|uniref:uncharacterized protein n=1 Tax=Palaemon carinicauda TaxID=392227 RepID=UPI0035B631B5
MSTTSYQDESGDMQHDQDNEDRQLPSHPGSPTDRRTPPAFSTMETLPLLSPHLTIPPPTATGGELRLLIKYLEESRQAELATRRREEDQRRHEEELRRQEDNLRREEEAQRFTALLQLLMVNPGHQQATPPDSQQLPTQSSVPSSSQHPLPQKAIAQTPPPLRPDATYQVFREWHRRWDDYSVMVDLGTLSTRKQLIQLRMCLSLETQRILEHTLNVSPDTDRSVEEVLNVLQEHIKNLRNEALRCRDLLSCKQREGESFSEFYVRLKHVAEEIDVCPGQCAVCEETQLKMIIIMGVRDEELTQKLIALDTSASLATMVNECRSYEATRTATTAIRAPPSKLCAVSTYKKTKGHGSKGATSHPNFNRDTSCLSCTKKHGSTEKCPAADSICGNCAGKGHWKKTSKCPANKATCRHCGRVGHYDRCCRQQMNAKQGGPPKATLPSSRLSNCRKVEALSTTTCPSPVPVSLDLTYKGETSKIMMLPDTGADVSVMGPQHLELLQINRNELQCSATSVTLTADGSQMTPALGTLKATLSLANRSCHAMIQVHEGVQMPLLSYAHCKELAIIPPDFPRPTLQVVHVNRCKDLPLHANSTPAEAREYFLRTFPDVLVSKEDLKAAPLRSMAGPPMKIHLKEDAVPFAIHTPRQIPYAFREPVKIELDSMVQQGIIKPCGDEPSEWCHPLVVAPKAKGVCITVDLTKLNTQVSRPAHPSPTPMAAVRTVDPTAKFFTTADALHDIALTAQPLRPLMSPKRSFIWTPDHDQAFKRVKQALSSPPVLASFDPTLPTILQTDASRLYGIGYALLQDHGSGRLRVVQCGSRFLADAETRYATIELEMLAVSWALTKCRLYLQGLPSFTLQTDHRPLVPIINSYTLDMIENPRLQRMKERMSQYQFTAMWRAGKSLCIPDALSRAPVSYPTSEDMIGCAEVTSHVRSVINVVIASQEEDATIINADRTLQDMSTAAQADPDYVRLRDCIVSGFPTNRYDLHASLLPYWKLREALSTDGTLVLYGARIIVPAALRRHTLARLHDSHRGVEATKRRARQTVFWPGIDSNIANTVAACEPCQVLRPSQQQEPLHNDDHPSRPFESVSADFFQVAGKSFLVVADRLSGWPVVVPCKGDTTASSTIRHFCRYFREVGVPLRLRTDGGPQFTSREFADFAERWGVHHITSSPHYPQSNGHAEATVKAVKHLILKTAPSGNIDCEAFDRGLLELRNMPNHSGRSPAQILYGHPLRTCVPAHPQSFMECWQERAHDCDRRVAARAAQVKRNYNAHARPLPRLNVGQHVRLQDPTSHRWDKIGIIMGGTRSREYEIRLPSGGVLRRNRRFLYPVPSPNQVPNSDLPVVPSSDMEKSSIPSTTSRRSPRLNRPT